MPHIFNLDGSEIKYKKVGKGNATSSRINLPFTWEGKQVAVVLLEELK